MDNVKDDNYYLAKIIDDIDFIIEHIVGLTEQEFLDDPLLVDSMQFRIIQISENSNKLSPEFKLRHPAIKWHEIVGMRNWIVHDYNNVNYSIVYETLKDDIVPLREELLG